MLLHSCMENKIRRAKGCAVNFANRGMPPCHVSSLSISKHRTEDKGAFPKIGEVKN